jgi:hypothetical protein
MTIIPKSDFKISQYKKTNLHDPVYLLSSARLRRGNIYNINNEFISKRILLSTCADKDYIIGFFHEDFAINLKKLTMHPYFVSTTNMYDLLGYCETSQNSVLVLNDKKNIWHKIDPGRPYDVSIHKIEFR